MHGLKYQTNLFPNGMVTGVFGTSANNNGIGIVSLSRLAQHLEQILFPQFVMPGALLSAPFGDSVFQRHNYLTIISCYDPVGTVEQHQMLSRLNFRMSGVRQSILHMYGQLFNLQKTPHQFKLYNNGELAYHTGVICFLLLNCYTCFNRSPCNSMFNMFPPTIQGYLLVDEVIMPFIDNDRNVYDFYVLDDLNA